MSKGKNKQTAVKHNLVKMEMWHLYNQMKILKAQLLNLLKRETKQLLTLKNALVKCVHSIERTLLMNSIEKRKY